MADSTETPDIISFRIFYLILGAATCFLEGYQQANTQLRVKLETAEINLQKVVQELKERDQLIEDLLDLQFPEPENGVGDEEEDENELESLDGDFDNPEAPTKNPDNEILYSPQNSEVDNIQGIERNSDSDSSVPTEEIGSLYGDGVSSSNGSDGEDSNYNSNEDGTGPLFRSFGDWFDPQGNEEDEEEFTSATEDFEGEDFEDAEQQDDERNASQEDARELWRGQTRVMEKVKRPLEAFSQNTIVQEEKAARLKEESN